MEDVMNETMRSHLGMLALVTALVPSVSACGSDKGRTGGEANPVTVSTMSAQAVVSVNDL
jgi:hypothetical protein